MRSRASARIVPRFTQMLLGSICIGVGVGLTTRCGLGASPWEVWHIGLAAETEWTVGTAVIVTNLAILLLWVPLRVKPGVGSIVGTLVPGLAIDGTRAALPLQQHLPWQLAVLVTGIVVLGCGTATQLGAGMGPGVRDGLMTGLAARGAKIWVARTGIECAVLAAGLILVGWAAAVNNGSLGWATIVIAVGVGPIIQRVLPVSRRFAGIDPPLQRRGSTTFRGQGEFS